MSFEAEIEVSGTCDACGKFIDEGDPIYCAKCAGPAATATSTDGRCNWTWGRRDGEYICGTTYEEWKWERPLPPFCPMCGRSLT